MNSRVFQILEFEKIKDKLKSYCASTLGKTMVDVMPIYDDVISVQRALEETGEAHQSIVKNGNPPIYGVYEVRELLRFVEKGGSLTPQSLLDIADGLRAASAIYSLVIIDRISLSSIFLLNFSTLIFTNSIIKSFVVEILSFNSSSS